MISIHTINKKLQTELYNEEQWSKLTKDYTENITIGNKK